ncbi:hypothetical protein [Rhodospira trueperi]|uniref:Uncharacterized protein n=1 Tax=Rhodospira trueperi TaxID=69960 RepID=A0A1G6X227_9PROT|nr:hypothetical protein [Rhodospira trueperi]SDD72250.1 hypothetical protein SAMN05421720_101349 [Rhodospira trueperi]
MTTDPRVIVTRPDGPNGPAVLAVYADDEPEPIVVVPLNPHRILRLARDLLAAVDPDEVEPNPRPAFTRVLDEAFRRGMSGQ